MEAPEHLAWERPHPLTMLVEIVDVFKQAALPILLVVGGGGGLDSLFELAIVIGPFGIAAARYFSTRYAIDETDVYHRYGVFNRTQQVLPRENVQNVASKSQLIARITGLTELQISDASAEGDINLRLLSREEGDRITSLLRGSNGFAGEQVSPAMITTADGSVVPAPPRPPLIKTSLGDLFRASVGHALDVGSIIVSVLIALIIIVVLIVADVSSLPTFAWLSAPALIPLFLLTVVPRALMPILRLGGFQLWADPDRIRSEAGLLTQQRTAARLERVQMVQVDHQAMLRRFGLERVRFATADLDTLSGLTGPGTYLDPGGTFGEWRRIASVVLGDIDVSEDELIQVSPLTRRRMLIRFVVLSGLFAVGACVAVLTGHGVVASIAVAAAAAVVLFGDWYSRRRYRRVGWAVGPTQMMLRTGAVDETLKILRKAKVQSVRLEQTFFQRRLGLASLHIGSAGTPGLGSMRVPDLELATARQLMEHLCLVSSATPLADTI